MRIQYTTLTLTVLAVLATTAGCASRPASTTTAASRAAPTSTRPATAPTVAGTYAAVNGLRMYYEVHGTGRPLVVLHGAFCTIDSCFGKLLPTLSATRRVIAIEQQAHGHTGDIDRPLTIAQMADDTAALLQQLGIADADVLGYSMGTGIGLDLAIRHPRLVRKLVLISPTFNKAGFHPGLLEMIDQITPEIFIGTPIHQAYVKVAPNPDHWARLVTKLTKMDREFVDVSPDAVKAMAAPTLILVGDSDMMRPEHIAEMFRLVGGGVMGDMVPLPRSQLAVLPATTHVTVMDRTAWLGSIVVPFLDAPMPAALR